MNIPCLIFGALFPSKSGLIIHKHIARNIVLYPKKLAKTITEAETHRLGRPPNLCVCESCHGSRTNSCAYYSDVLMKFSLLARDDEENDDKTTGRSTPRPSSRPTTHCSDSVENHRRCPRPAASLFPCVPASRPSPTCRLHTVTFPFPGFFFFTATTLGAT